MRDLVCLTPSHRQLRTNLDISGSIGLRRNGFARRDTAIIEATPGIRLAAFSDQEGQTLIGKRLLIGSLTFATLHLSAPASGSAPDTCFGPSCTGRNPNDTVCAADARTVDRLGGLKDSVPFSGTYLYAPGLHHVTVAVPVELRYSPRCRANWAKIRWLESGIHGELSIWNPGRPSQRTWVDAYRQGNHFTPMVDGTRTACLGMQVYVNGVWRAWRFGYCG